MSDPFDTTGPEYPVVNPPSSNAIGEDRRFYVYEHWRPDLCVCFWVGKGTGDRSRRTKRNTEYNRVIETLSELGMCVEVRLIMSGLSEIDAYRREEDRINYWLNIGVKLTNISAGGRGNHSRVVTSETRQKLRQANLGRKASAETRAKMSASQKARNIIESKPRMRGYKRSPEIAAKISASNKGRRLSEEHKAKLRAINLGKNHSPETKRKMSDGLIGNKNGCGGRGLKRSIETKNRISEAQIGHAVSESTRRKLAEIARKQIKERSDNGRFRPTISS